MAEHGVQRRLAAILAADVVGYSRLIRANEEGTLAAVGALISDVIEPAVAQHGGRVFKKMGDAVLAEFQSTVDAVRCAIIVQGQITDRATEMPPDRRIAFRIGLHVGDVVVDGEDIQGDGVNVASRIEGLAQADGICISEDVFRQVEGRIPAGFEDIGPQRLKNIDSPIRAYRVQPDAARQGKVVTSIATRLRRLKWPAAALAVVVVALVVAKQFGVFPVREPSRDGDPTIAEQAKTSSSEMPSIAVLPFINMTSDQEQEYFADGIVVDLITDLSKLSSLAVIARNSAFYYKGKTVKVQDVASELGVRYVLEGSVRRAGNRVRINVQLIDARSGKHLWAERYDRDLSDIFAVQDGVVLHIVETLSVKLTAGDQARLRRRDTESIEAYDYALRGRKLMLSFDYKDAKQAKSFFEKAIALDPNYAAAHVALGRLHHEAWRLWGEDRNGNLARAIELGLKAVALNPEAPDGQMLLAQVYNHQGNAAEAQRYIQDAMALEPNNPDTLAAIGEIFRGTERSGEAIAYLKRAMRLDPHYPTQYLSWLGMALFVTGDYAEAIRVLRRGIVRTPNYVSLHVGLTASYAMAGELDKAKASAKDVLRLNPKFNLRAFKKYSLSQSRKIDQMMVGLRKAGLPQ